MTLDTKTFSLLKYFSEEEFMSGKDRIITDRKPNINRKPLPSNIEVIKALFISILHSIGYIHIILVFW